MAATQQVKQGSVVLFILRTALEGPSRPYGQALSGSTFIRSGLEAVSLESVRGPKSPYRSRDWLCLRYALTSIAWDRQTQPGGTVICSPAPHAYGYEEASVWKGVSPPMAVAAHQLLPRGSSLSDLPAHLWHSVLLTGR